MLKGWRNRDGGRVERGLLALAAVLVVNTAVLITAAGVVTLPLGFVAGSEALYRWRQDSEEYLVAAFVRSLRRDVGRRLVVGWTAVGAVAWGVAVILEGAKLQLPWRVVAGAVGLAELLVAVPFAWFSLTLGWACDGRCGSLFRSALILSVQVPATALVLDIVTVTATALAVEDPNLLIAGLVALTGLVGQWFIERALGRRHVVLSRPLLDETGVSGAGEDEDRAKYHSVGG